MEKVSRGARPVGTREQGRLRGKAVKTHIVQLVVSHLAELTIFFAAAAALGAGLLGLR